MAGNVLKCDDTMPDGVLTEGLHAVHVLHWDCRVVFEKAFEGQSTGALEAFGQKYPIGQS